MLNIPSGAACFAAQNSYNGFKSNFASIFNSKEYDRIYVLKGGPGTGKSSLMKKIRERFSTESTTVNSVYCSSDTSSLDGLIVEGCKRRIAILDGTAPHERDAIFPGAIDELINLGECWRRDKIVANRDAILELNAKKSTHYKRAYEFLSVSGNFAKLINRGVRDNYDFCKADAFAEKITASVGTPGAENSIIISAFGKNGYFTTDAFSNTTDKRIGVYGRFNTDLLFLSIMRGFLKSKSCKYIRCIYPLDENETEAIYIPDEKILFCRDENGEVNAEDFLHISAEAAMVISEYSADELKYKNLAQRELRLASVAHFALEDIYTPCMDFDKLDAIYEKICTDISKILEL